MHFILKFEKIGWAIRSGWLHPKHQNNSNDYDETKFLIEKLSWANQALPLEIMYEMTLGICSFQIMTNKLADVNEKKLMILLVERIILRKQGVCFCWHVAVKIQVARMTQSFHSQFGMVSSRKKHISRVQFNAHAISHHEGWIQQFFSTCCMTV